jgi:hypothetical protein
LRLSSLDQLNKPDWVIVIATQDWYVAFGYFLDPGWSIALVHDRIFRVEGAYGNPCLAAGVFLPHARLSSHIGKLPWKMDRFLFLSFLILIIIFSRNSYCLNNPNFMRILKILQIFRKSIVD